MPEIQEEVLHHPHTGEKHVHVRWKFTEDDLREYREQFKLSGITGGEFTDRFLLELEEWCRQFYRLSKLTAHSRQRKELNYFEDMKRDARNLLRKLCAIANGEEKYLLPSNIVDMGNDFLPDHIKEGFDKENPNPVYRFNRGLRESAASVIGPLAAFTETAEILAPYLPVKRRGRPDADATGFCKQLAWLFMKYIGIPTAYGKGPFVRIVEITRERLELPCGAVERPVSLALRALKRDNPGFWKHYSGLWKTGR